MKKSVRMLWIVMLCMACSACGAKNSGSVETSAAETFSVSESDVSDSVETDESGEKSSDSTENEASPAESSTSLSEDGTTAEESGAGLSADSTNAEESRADIPEDNANAAKSGSETTVAAADPWFTEINRLVLDPADEYYLTDQRMEGYRKAMDAVFNHESEVQLTDSYDDNLAILWYLQHNPYTFVLSDYDVTKDHRGAWFEYQYSAEECTEMMDLIDQEYLTLINAVVTPDMTELEKVLAVYHYFAERISYDYDWVDALNMSDEQYQFPDIVIYQALTTNKGVCHTYTYLCQFAFQQLGIDCVRATAQMTDSDEGHMWPIVWIDGIPYHIDPTWDRNGDSVSLRYFGMTDEENWARGINNEWGCSIDEALDIACTDDRFAEWRDIVDYQLIGNHQMKAVREDGTTDIIDLQDYE